MILATGEIIIISKYNIHTYLGWKKEEGSFLLRIPDTSYSLFNKTAFMIPRKIHIINKIK